MARTLADELLQKPDAVSIMKSKATNKLAKPCIRCQSLKLYRCDTEPGKGPCGACIEAQEECNFLSHMATKLVEFKKASEVTMADIRPWDGPNSESAAFDENRAKASKILDSL